MTQLAGPGAFLGVSRGDAVLRADPIEPSWVLEGDPVARTSGWAESADGTTSHWTWDCTAGRFRWHFALDETIVVICGSVRIDVAGHVHELAVGDAAYFPAGTWSVWTVEDHVRKHAVLRVPVPRAMAYAVNGFGRRTHRLRPGTAGAE